MNAIAATGGPHLVKSTQYKKLAPNALWFTFRDFFQHIPNLLVDWADWQDTICGLFVVLVASIFSTHFVTEHPFCTKN